MAVRSCVVSVVDISGIRHSAEVVAETLNEAAVLGLKALQGDRWVEPIGGSTRIEVQVREASTTHVTTVTKIQAWLNGATPSPNEKVKKERLKRLLAPNRQ